MKLILFSIFLFPALSFAQSLAIPVYSTQDYKYAALKYNDFQLIAFTGGFHPLRDLNPLGGLIQKLDANKPVVFWMLGSSGGYAEAFIQTMNAIKKKTGTVEVLINGYCASACTMWGAMGDRTILVGDKARMVVHRTWVILPQWTLQTPRQMARTYGRLGANEQWFLDNLYVLNAPKNDGVTLTSRQSYEAGLADGVASESYLNELFGKHIVDALKKSFAGFKY